MDVQELADGLWRWTTFHPEWKQVVGCVYYEAADAVVLIDPLVPEDEADRFWKALDRDVETAGKPVHVLVTVFWHTRSSKEVAERYDAGIWAPSRGRAAIERRAGAVTDAYAAGHPLPGGVVPYATARAAEVVFWIPKHRAVVPGDVILGADGGGLRLCPRSWLPDKVELAKLAESLRPLLELRAQRVIVSHGEPVLARGHAALQRILDA
jgi:glyoxylase-like metal-dependent hydrolase (beta-lactamase superfamily II)